MKSGMDIGRGRTGIAALSKPTGVRTVKYDWSISRYFPSVELFGEIITGWTIRSRGRSGEIWYPVAL
jgi:hypothetical protein